MDDLLKWPPDPAVLERDRLAAFEAWGPKTQTIFDDLWVKNWISNFLSLKVPLEYQGLIYPTIEHFYQAMKSKDKEYRKVISQCPKPNKTKFMAAKLNRLGEVREDWYDINIDVMTYGQRHRIETDPVFYDRLRGTRGEYIYEWCNWSDYFWAVSIYTGQGENVLGRILMHLRDNVYFPSKARK